MRAVIQIIACAPTPISPVTCGAAVAGLTLATGGSLGDAAKAVAFSFASMGIFDQIGLAFGDLGAMIKEVGVVGASVLKGGVHGVVGGALSLAQGGSFQEGFAANAIGAVTGVVTGALNVGNMIADTTIVAAAGCGGAVLSGGKCATGAITAAFANMYNKYNATLARRAAFSATARVAPLAIGLAIADGPLPFGEVVGGVLTAGSLIYDLVLAPVDGIFNADLDPDNQGKHVPGHKNYRPGRSVLTHEDPQGLLDEGAGNGQPVGSPPGVKERYDWGIKIGEYQPKGGGSSQPTSVGIIHHGTRGSHIVPARPKE